jgi:hypothetical protein
LFHGLFPDDLHVHQDVWRIIHDFIFRNIFLKAPQWVCRLTLIRERSSGMALPKSSSTISKVNLTAILVELVMSITKTCSKTDDEGLLDIKQALPYSDQKSSVYLIGRLQKNGPALLQ